MSEEEGEAEVEESKPKKSDKKQLVTDGKDVDKANDVKKKAGKKDDTKQKKAVEKAMEQYDEDHASSLAMASEEGELEMEEGEFEWEEGESFYEYPSDYEAPAEAAVDDDDSDGPP